jgi:hypothetical protein
MVDKDSFLMGLERAAQFHDDQAHIYRLAIEAKFPTEHRAADQSRAVRDHEHAAKAIRGMKENYQTGKLDLPSNDGHR